MTDPEEPAPPGTAPALTAAQRDRAVGAILGTAVGDALGSQYEFGPALADDVVPEFGVGHFGHGLGEWTDDTSMAVPILEALAAGESLRDGSVLARRVLARWIDWARDAKDVGTQTRAVLGRLGPAATEEEARAAAEAVHRGTGRSAGNGSLMRIAPVALGYLSPGRERELVEAAERVTRLTHWERSNVEATALWSLLIRRAILTGQIDPAGERLRLIEIDPGLDGADLVELGPVAHPRDFTASNGWVVAAFRAALAAVVGASSLPEAVFRAIRGGGDTDTVAAIAGALAGARWGADAIPSDWRRRVHGWPGYDAGDLERLVLRAVGGAAEGSV